MLRAIVFDFDGVILETEEPEYIAWRDAWADHGVTLALEEWVHCIGTVDAFDPMAELIARASGPVDPVAVQRHRRAAHQALVEAMPVSPGVRAVLAQCAELGLSVAVASSSSRSWVAGHLGRIGLLGSFPVLSCYDGTCPAKPAPDLYLRAVAHLGVIPSDALAIEDSPNGIRAAKAAGLRCAAVPGPLTRRLDLSQADLRLDSLDDLRVDDLRRTLW